MNAEQLKASILQQAIEGKLVPQFDSEESVTQIEGELKNPPFVIPRNWKWTTLNAVGKWKAGGTPSRSVTEYYENGTIPWLKTGDLTDGKVSVVEEYITKLGVENSSAHINPKGAVLIAMYGATIGKIGILEMDCATNQACCACVVKEEVVSNWYLFYYLLSQRKGFISLGAGGAQPNISRTKIINYPIPVPPLDEQKRIVAKVEELLPLIEAYGKSYDRLQELNAELPGKLKASILQEAIQGKLVPQLDSEEEVQQIGDAPKAVPFTIPEKWKWVKIKSVFTMQAGKFISASSIRTEGKVPCYGGNGLRGYVDEANRNGHFPLIGRQGALCGNVHVVNGEFYATEHAVVVDCGNYGDPECVGLFLKAMNLNQYATATAQPGLSVKKIVELPFPLPPKSEQVRIASKVKELMKQVEALSGLEITS